MKNNSDAGLSSIRHSDITPGVPQNQSNVSCMRMEFVLGFSSNFFEASTKMSSCKMRGRMSEHKILCLQFNCFWLLE